MKQFANNSKWSAVYISLNNQAKNNEQIIFSKIPDNVSEEEIQDVLKELCFLSNFKNYSISRNNQNIRGIKKYV
jgi:hypothetical protein